MTTVKEKKDIYLFVYRFFFKCNLKLQSLCWKVSESVNICMFFQYKVIQIRVKFLKKDCNPVRADKCKHLPGDFKRTEEVKHDGKHVGLLRC